MLKKLLLSIIFSFIFATPSFARDQIRAVGSSTVYPFTTTVAEQFGNKQKGKFKTPIIESTGTGGGFKLFCESVSVDSPDIANASRRIKPEELLNCYKNNVTDISEIKFGYDGIVIANALKSPAYDLTTKDLFLALGKNVPDPKNPNRLIPNPYKTWDQVNPKLPKNKISVYGPPTTSGTRDSFAELVLEAGCWSFPVFEKTYTNMDERKKACRSMREDGAYIEAGENDNLIVQKLNSNKNSLGIFGYSFLEENKSIVKAAKIGGVEPTHPTISSGKYPVSRPLYVYVKRQHIAIVPGIQEFLAELMSDDAAGELGYLEERGLIPLHPDELKQSQAEVKAGKKLANLAEDAPAKTAKQPAKK